MNELQREALDFLCGAAADFAPRRRFWQKDMHHESAIRAACACLMDAMPEEALARLCVTLWNSERELRKLLAPLVLHLATRLAPHAWPRIDEAIRFDWKRPVPMLAPVKISVDPAMVIVALCHPRGNVREEALTLSRVLPAAVEVCLLLVRANDWATPVHERAAKRLSAALERLDPEERITLAPLTARLRECGRRCSPEQIEGWFKRLAMNLDEAAWLRAWRLSRGKDRKVYLELLKKVDRTPGREIRRALFGSNDRAALMWYVRGVLPRLNIAERAEAIQAIAASRAVPVRRHWLDHRMECEPGAAVAELTATLPDRSSSLRQFARFHLARLSPMDFAAYYKKALNDPSLEPWALRGLAEVSPAMGHQEALARLGSEVGAVKKAAIECLDAETLGSHLDFLLQALASTQPGPAKAARQRLRAILPQLGSHLVNNPGSISQLDVDLQAYFVRLAPLFSKWKGLEFLLTRANDACLRDDVLEALGNWRRREGRSYIKISPTKKSELLGTLSKAKVPGKLGDVLRYTLERAE